MSAESQLRNKAVIFSRGSKAPPEWVYLAEREYGGDLTAAAHAELRIFKTLQTMKNWSDIVVRVEYNELLMAPPTQETLF